MERFFFYVKVVDVLQLGGLDKGEIMLTATCGDNGYFSYINTDSNNNPGRHEVVSCANYKASVAFTILHAHCRTT